MCSPTENFAVVLLPEIGIVGAAIATSASYTFYALAHLGILKRKRSTPLPKGMHSPDLPNGLRAWKNIWSGGHSTGLVDDVPSVAELVDRLGAEFAAARDPRDWRAALARSLT